MKPKKKSDDDSLFNCNRPLRTNEIMKTSALRKCKYYIYLILAVSDITTTVAPLTHRWQRRKKKNCMPPSFSGYKSKNIRHESSCLSCDGVSGTDNDEQWLNNSASVFYLSLLEAFSWFQNGSLLLVNAELSESRMNRPCHGFRRHLDE